MSCPSHHHPRPDSGAFAPAARLPAVRLAMRLAGCVPCLFATCLPAMAESTGSPPADVSPALPDWLARLEKSKTVSGDMAGFRPWLRRNGMTLSVQETSEVLGNATGGLHRGVDYDGLTQATLQLDTQRAFGWHGGLFHISALQIHGRSLSADNLDSLQTASGIEADRATRLWEMWYQQKFLPGDRLDIKVGLQSADQEFLVNSNELYFLNTMFGWPVVPSYDLPGGGPAYPLSAPAVRVRWRPVKTVSILLGVFSGSPASTNAGDAQAVNASGTQFALDHAPLVLAELRYADPPPGTPPRSGLLGRTYRIGFWYDAEGFDDEAVDSSGRSLALPGSTGIPARHHGDYAFYAIVDQMVWRARSRHGDFVSLFGRAVGTPQGNRNEIDYSADGGLVWHAPLAGRDQDIAGLGVGYAHVSADAASLDRVDAAIVQRTIPGTSYPVRSSETFVETTYQIQLLPSLQLQPDLQYVFNPGGGVQDTTAPTHRVRDELVIGLRMTVTF